MFYLEKLNDNKIDIYMVSTRYNSIDLTVVTILPHASFLLPKVSLFAI